MFEWLGAAIGLPDTLQNLWEIGDKSRSRRIHRELGALAFWEGGFRNVLSRISQGKGTSEDFDEIKRLLRASQDKVYRANTYLRSRRKKIIKLFGAGVALQIEQILDSKMGATAIRWALERLALAPDSSQQLAQITLEKIDAFNKLVESIPPPK